ncbi:hypothetical protein PENTCL1PPCAC_29220, partial [Pristionchus entomophagus]
MFYCLLKIGDLYEISDRSMITGPELAWGEVEVKRGRGSKEKALYVNGGSQKEMLAEKNKYENGILKPKRPKKHPLFSVVDPPSENDDGEEELEEAEENVLRKGRPTRQAALQVKVEKTTPPPPPKKGRDNSLPPAALPSSTAPSASGPTVSTKPPSPTVPSAVTPSTSSASAATPVSASPGTVTLDIIYGLLCDVKSQVDRLSARQDRMEDQLRDVYNDTVGIRHESRQLVDCTKEAKERIGELTVVAEKIKEQLPRPPKGPQYDIYEGWTEERVAEIDDKDDSLLVFAGKLDRAFFQTSPLPHQQRNQEKLRWLVQIVLHRRRDEVKSERKKWRSLILQRINGNATREEEKIYIDRQMQAFAGSRIRKTFTPPVHLSST